MSDYLARKVDQQLAFCQQLAELLEQSTANSAALISAATLQVERTVCWYLLEQVKAFGKTRALPNWVLTHELLDEITRTNANPHLLEFVELARQSDSWLANLLDWLSTQRSTETSRLLKGELFASDAVSSESTAANVLIVSSRSAASVFKVEDLLVSVVQLQNLIRRQRIGNEEY